MSTFQPQTILRAKAAAALLAVFIFGGGTGYVAGYWCGAPGPWFGPGSPWRGEAASPGDAKDILLRKLEGDLKLSPSQCTRVSEILRFNQRRFLDLNRDMTPRVDAILEDARWELRSLMDPGQRECFDQMVQSSMKRCSAPRQRGQGFGAGSPP